jgi:hypothetical protein
MNEVREKKYLFLDTNLHIHFQDFDQIDWPKVLMCKSVCLVFAPIVFSELEKHKYDRDSQRRQKRARSITKKINEIILTNEPSVEAPVKGRNNVTALMLTDSPELSLYSGLQTGIGDDELVASILKFSSDHQDISRNNIVLVSDDGGVLNKARARGIQIHLIDDTLRLPDEPTIEQEKINRLERRIKEIEEKQPKLSLSFLADNLSPDSLEFNIKIPPDPSEQNLQNLLEKERKSISWAAPKPPVAQSHSPAKGEEADSILDIVRKAEASGSAAMLAGNLMNGIPQSEIDRYQEDVEEYLQTFKKYLLDLLDFEKFNSLTRRITLQILNDGNIPATGLIIRISFPEELDVFDWDEFPDKPERPEKPQEPRRQMDMLMAGLRITVPDLSHLNDISSRITGTIDPDTIGPKITRNSPAIAEWTRTKVLHKVPLILTTIGIIFPNQPGDKSYEIGYEIFAENLPQPVEGKLRIQVHTEIKSNLWR